MRDSSTHITRKNPLKIIFLASDRSKGLGDNIISLDTLFAIKSMFECHLVVIANAMLARLLDGFGFYDELFLLAEKLDDERNIKLINSFHCDFLISGGCKRYQLKILESTNARCIITHTKPYSLLKPRFKTSPTLLYRTLSHKDSLLLFLRRIDKRRFDSIIGALDFTQAKLAISEAHRVHIAEFLGKELVRKGILANGNLDSGGSAESSNAESKSTESSKEDSGAFFGLDSSVQTANLSNLGFFSQKARDFRDLAVCLMRGQKSATSYSMPNFFTRFTKPSMYLDSANMSSAAPANDITPANDIMPTIKIAQNQPKFLVLVNPFCLTADKNLTPNGWLKLMDKISQRGCFIPVVATYDKVHDEFVKSLESYDAKNSFKNNASDDAPNDTASKAPPPYATQKPHHYLPKRQQLSSSWCACRADGLRDKPKHRHFAYGEQSLYPNHRACFRG